MGETRTFPNLYPHTRTGLQIRVYAPCADVSLPVNMESAKSVNF